MPSTHKLIVALDFDSMFEVQQLVTDLGDLVDTYKIGHQLFTAVGPEVIKYLKQQNKKVFLDLKLLEIANSVSSAVHNAGKLGVDMMSVHATGGATMLQAAVAASSHYQGLKILALTVVTGLDDNDLSEIGFAYNSADLTMRLALLAQGSGCHGLICSAEDCIKIRVLLGEDMLLVTPGIRPAGSQTQDQKRVGTPEQAIASGASRLVIGRPITQAPEPRATVAQILSSIANTALN
ncbi:MAG: orotidine-5'-phosphate decarboxylase [Pseudomonadales bacterium]|nr:orotidine-5'-phosphate decarboxylase [Pseudomonadales bacterium]NRA17262.1 orotidine-5'-phosphate decarboxylase [Oceanospirillaceae bacterium]